ncbi:MAG: SPOR domain-containing protein, partial [bacterium]
MTALKSAVALLLLANLAVYLWVGGDEFGGGNAAPARPDEAAEINQEGMLLLREIRPPPSAAPVVAPDDARDASGAPEKPSAALVEVGPDARISARCYRIGPFAPAEDWAAAGRWMAAQRLAYRAVRSERREMRATRVFLGPFESRAAAAPALRRLEQAGIEHYPISPASDSDGGEGAVLFSVGYFTQAALALRFAADLRARGFDAASRSEYRAVGPFDWME